MSTLPDSRYTVTSAGGTYIARFCQRLIGAYATKAAAILACLEYHAERLEGIA